MTKKSAFSGLAAVPLEDLMREEVLKVSIAFGYADDANQGPAVKKALDSLDVSQLPDALYDFGNYSFRLRQGVRKDLEDQLGWEVIPELDYVDDTVPGDFMKPSIRKTTFILLESSNHSLFRIILLTVQEKERQIAGKVIN